MLTAGVELGGTKCIAILADGPGRIAAQASVPTTDPGTTLAGLRAILESWRPRFASIGIGAFGPLDLDITSPGYGSLRGTPKAGWDGVNLVSAFAGLGAEVHIDTDVNGAALAEGAWGAAQRLNSWTYITVGTGVGVGTIIDRRPVAGLGHSEAGHLRVSRLPGDDWPGACPFHGDCVEGLASGPAIAARAGVPGEALEPESPAWDSVLHALAGLCHNLVLTAAPQRILVGGGVVASRPDLLPQLRSRLLASLGGYAFAALIEGDDNYLGAPGLGRLAGPLGAIAIGASG